MIVVGDDGAGDGATVVGRPRPTVTVLQSLSFSIPPISQEEEIYTNSRSVPILVAILNFFFPIFSHN